MTHRGNIFLILIPVILIALAGPAFSQTTYFTGKITEISKEIELGLGKHGTIFIIKLDSKPNMQFRITREDAVKFGLIDDSGPSAALPPQKLKGLGWKVKLTVYKEERGLQGAPLYHVRGVERLND